MIPLVGTVEELAILRKRAIAVADEVMTKAGIKVDYLIGTMIEVPRAALTADRIAEEAEFFSFGTNDLTQMTFGFSRDDIKSFVQTYMDQKILPIDPFQSLDVSGVGQLVEMGVAKGRKARKEKTGEHLKVGICGEHGGDPDSVAFCHKVGHGLRLLLPLPRPDRPPRRRPGRPGRGQDDQPRSLIDRTRDRRNGTRAAGLADGP